MRVAVIGASGYIGSHLVPKLLEAGHKVVACARHRDVLEGRGWRGAEIRTVDLMDEASIPAAIRGCDAAYYLVHSMGESGDFVRRDRMAARNFRQAAEAEGLKRIIYLGGMVPKGRISRHLKSRAETGNELRKGRVPVTELRGGIIVGAGSAGFEIIRDLVNNLPVMIVPRWVQSATPPIALDDVLRYLAGCLTNEETIGETFDVGGAEILQYADLLRQFGEVTGRHPRLISVPMLTPRLSSYWLGLVTSVPSSVARPLVDGLREDLLPGDNRIQSLIPFPLHTYREAVITALQAERSEPLPARWTEGALRFRGYRQDVSYFAKGERNETPSNVDVDTLWRVVCSLGGQNGWFYADWLWKLRGTMDRLVGGPGMRRGRRHPIDVRVGDAIDFWRVVAVEHGKRLTLMAEMKLPGEAVLEFEVKEQPDKTASLVTTARFHPRGVFGFMYWYAVTPLHHLVFRHMPEGIVREAEQSVGAAVTKG